MNITLSSRQQSATSSKMKSFSQILAVLVSLSAAGVQAGCTPFTAANTNTKSCCDQSSNFLFWVDLALELGFCCPFGTTFDGLGCVTPPSPPSAPICSGQAVCPAKSGQDLGIKYGSCYVLQSLSGLYLGHDSATKYEVEGENPGVVFRVCHDTTTCTTNVGNVVGVNSTWYMQDQFGIASGSGFGWLGGSGDLTVQPSGSDALVLGGSSLCYGGKCSVCITFPPGGAAAPCPLQPGQSHLGVANNPNSCQPFIWQQVPCRSEM